MTTRLTGIGRPARALVLAGAFWLGIASIEAQPVAGVSGARTFKVPKFNPKTRRLESLLTGKKATLLDSGLLEVNDVRVEFYHYPEGKRALDLAVESPQCQYDERRRLVYSTSELDVRAADGRFQVLGRGWRWDLGASSLVISNDVRTALQRLQLAGATSAPSPVVETNTLHVVSRRFRYNFSRGTATYWNDVKMTEAARLELHCAWLAADLLVSSNQLEQVTARTNVVLRLKRTNHWDRVTGREAVYTMGARGEQVRVSGPAAWENPQSRGRAEELLVLPEERTFRAHGHGHLTFIGAGPFFAWGTPNTGAAKSPARNAKAVPPVTIDFDHGELLPGALHFGGGVVITQGEDFRLDGDSVDVGLTTSNRVTSVSARGARLKVRQEGFVGELRGREMELRRDDQGNGRLRVTGEGRWETSQYSGRGRVLQVDLKRRAFQADGDGVVTVLPQALAGRRRGQGETLLELGAQPVQIHAAHYAIAPGTATFRGAVRVTHPAWDLTCRSLDFQLDPKTREIRRIHAEGGVRVHHRGSPVSASSPAVEANEAVPMFFLGNGSGGRPEWTMVCETLDLLSNWPGEAGQRIEANGPVQINQGDWIARGGRLTYRAADAHLVLSGSPSLVSARGFKMIGESDTVFTVDTAQSTFLALGLYDIVAPAKAFGNLSSALGTEPEKEGR